MRPLLPSLFFVLSFLLQGAPVLATRDGKRFDPGATMTARATGATEQLDRVAFMRGQWDVTYETWEGDSLTASLDGQAELTYFNRGHGLMERFYIEEFGDDDISTVSFLVCNAAGVWVMGTANSYTESITVHSGGLEGSSLVLYNALRRKGGNQLTLYRTTLRKTNDDAFTIDDEVSTDAGKTWARAVMRAYSRRRVSSDFMAPSSTYGEPAPGLPEEARQFDFLIGEWNNQHDMTFANGRTANFPANGTAVYALNGHAVMEFSWYDVDQSLPDAATSILRIYNRQMRRWECMYTTNRFNSILYFGGVMEGDRIVLHLFEADASDSPISQWIFHDWKEDSYRWHANTSTDRGKTWNKTWIIEATKN